MGNTEVKASAGAYEGLRDAIGYLTDYLDAAGRAVAGGCGAERLESLAEAMRRAEDGTRGTGRASRRDGMGGAE